MSNNPVTGLGHVLAALRMLNRPGLRQHLAAPLAINVIVFLLIGWLGFSQFDALMEWLLPEQSWYSFFRWLLWPLFALTLILIMLYSFTAVANLLAAPFNGILAAKVEEMITGQRPPEAMQSLAASLWPTIRSELRKLGYFLVRAIPLLILFVIPGVNLVAPLLWILFSAWFLAIEYGDYPMANHGLTFASQHQRLKQVRLTALGLGGGITLMMMIPILNFAAMPVGVIAATRLWCEHPERTNA